MRVEEGRKGGSRNRHREGQREGVGESIKIEWKGERREAEEERD